MELKPNEAMRKCVKMGFQKSPLEHFIPVYFVSRPFERDFK